MESANANGANSKKTVTLGDGDTTTRSAPDAESSAANTRTRPEDVQYAYNKTRQAFLASDLDIAVTHWRRLIGLLGTRRSNFTHGRGLWIAPCHGVHTFAMTFAIDVVYLDVDRTVVHLEENVRPWRVTPVLMNACSVLELPLHTIFSTGTSVGDNIELAIESGNKVAA
ncbi:MAG TPA: DUF192 domain-containing protein [Clostridia bacterium]|nr:DUF192 domain-containing protein [Clostridia bacterium]